MWQGVIPDVKLAVPLKATSVMMSASLIRSELHPIKSDSPYVHNSRALIIVKMTLYQILQTPPLIGLE